MDEKDENEDVFHENGEEVISEGDSTMMRILVSPALTMNGIDATIKDDKITVIERENNKSPEPPLKPIQRILSRAKPSSHSTQTRYQTRTRSCSLPARMSRYSNGETPFACDTKMSLIDLANKLAAADRKINGKKDAGEKRSVGRPSKVMSSTHKTMLLTLKKKIQALNVAKNDEGGSQTPVQIQLPTSLINPQSMGFSNGEPITTIQSPDMLHSKQFKTIKVDLFQKLEDDNKASSPTLTKVPKSSGYAQESRARLLKRNLASMQKARAVLAQAEAKRRELECVRRLEAQRAQEKQQSKESAVFNAKAIECYNDALRLMEYISSKPDDSYLQPYLPPAVSLPLWPLLSNTLPKDSGIPLQSSIEKAIKEKHSRKRSHAVMENSNMSNAEMPSLTVPEPLTELETEAVLQKAITHSLQNRIPKFAKRTIDAAKYAAESGLKHILISEQARREREARGFGPPSRKVPAPLQPIAVLKQPPPPVLSRQMINVLPSPVISSPLVPVSLIAIPTTVSRPTNTSALKMRATVAYSRSPYVAKSGRLVRRHKCSECSYQTNNRSHLRRHIGSVHSNIKLFSCYVCDKEFARGEKCKAHIGRDHPGIPYDHKRIRRHTIKLPEEMSPLDLSKASQKTAASSDKNYVVENIAIKSEDDQNNIDISIKSEAANSHDKATYAHSKASPQCVAVVYNCSRCTYVGRDSWHVQRHMTEVHAAIRNFKCSVCSYATGRKHRLINHMKKHGELFCFHCSFSTTVTSVFYHHLKLCSTHWRANMLTCEKCHRMYSNRKQMQQHLSKEHNTEIFFCDICPYSSTEFEQFEKHSEEHFNGNSEHYNDNILNKTDGQCSVCSFKSNQSHVMQEHLKTHTKDALLQCSITSCDFTSQLGSSMQLHLKCKHKKNQQPVPDAPFQTEHTAPSESCKSQFSPDVSQTTSQSPVVSPQAVASYPVILSSLSTAISAIPMYANPVPPKTMTNFSASSASQEMASTRPILPTPTSSPAETSQAKPASQPANQPANQTAGRPSGSPLLYDSAGGLRGHGSGLFVCPYCPGKMPFKYRRSFEKHVYRHKKAGQTKYVPTTVVKIKCPEEGCIAAFNTNAEVEHHLVSAHKISIGSNEPNNEGHVEVIELSDGQESENESSGREESDEDEKVGVELSSDIVQVEKEENLQTASLEEECNSKEIDKALVRCFECPYCPDRRPFIYKRSYEKHIYKHKKEGTTNKLVPATLTTVRCPVATCMSVFNTYIEIQGHLSKVHGKNADGSKHDAPISNNKCSADIISNTNNTNTNTNIDIYSENGKDGGVGHRSSSDENLHSDSSDASAQNHVEEQKI